VTEQRQDGADFECSDRVLVTGTWHVGREGNNLYVTDEDGTEYYVGALFRAKYGPAVVGWLNLARMVASESGLPCSGRKLVDNDVVWLDCALERGHDGQHHGIYDSVGYWWS